jgi:hypothetical protein
MGESTFPLIEAATKMRPVLFYPAIAQVIGIKEAIFCSQILYWTPKASNKEGRHPDHGLVVLEKKSMSNFAFRRALLGQIDLKYRAQLWSFAESLGLPVVVLAYRSETAHILEVFYTLEKSGDVKVTITKTNGQSEIYYVHRGKLAMTPEGPAEDLPDSEWEAAETLTPTTRTSRTWSTITSGGSCWPTRTSGTGATARASPA